MRNALLLLILVLVLGACRNVGAVGKVTADPNAPSARAAAGEDQQWDKDARLAQKVTYEARQKAVKVILSDLSQMSGVTICAGYNDQDWQVRDRKMNVFAKGVPLARLMRSIARVMKFKWKVSKDAQPWTYRLYMDRATLLGTEQQFQKAEEAFDEEITRRRESFAKMIDNWSDNLSPSEMEQLRKDNPYLYLLHSHGIGAAVQALFKEVPGVRDSFVNKQRDMWPMVSKLSPDTQQLIMKAAKYRYQLKGADLAGNGEPFPEEYEKLFPTAQMSLDIVPDELGWKSIEQRKFMGFGFLINGHYFQVYDCLGEPSDPLIQCQSEMELQVYEKDLPIDQVCLQNRETINRAYAEESQTLDSYFPTEPAPYHPDTAALRKNVRLQMDKAKGSGLIGFQEALASASGFAVVSDSFKFANGYADVGESEAEIRDILDTISDGYCYNWQEHESVIEFRSKDWFRKRTTQIPDEWVDQWHANAKKLGYVSIEDYAQIAKLTTPQIRENIWTDQLLRQLNAFRSDRPTQIWLMRVYSSLSAKQRKALFSEKGLNLKSFGSEQWRLQRMLFTTPAMELPEATSIYKCTVDSKKNEPPIYNFQLTSTATTFVAKWPIELLKWQGPATEAQPKPASDAKTGADGKPVPAVPTTRPAGSRN